MCALQQQLVSEGVYLTLCIHKKGPCRPRTCHFAALLIYACLHVVCFGWLHREPCNASVARASHNICSHAKSMTQQKTLTKELPWSVMQIKWKEISRIQRRWGGGGVDMKTVVVFWGQGMEQESTVDLFQKNKIEESPNSGMWYLIKATRMMRVFFLTRKQPDICCWWIKWADKGRPGKGEGGRTRTAFLDPPVNETSPSEMQRNYGQH